MVVPPDVLAHVEALKDRLARAEHLLAERGSAAPTTELPEAVVAYVKSLEDERDALTAALADADPDHPLVTGEDRDEDDDRNRTGQQAMFNELAPPEQRSIFADDNLLR